MTEPESTTRPAAENQSARPTPRPDTDLLGGLLRDVSRSFYLTLRVLPQSIRPQVGLAYLLARATDTIADTSLVSLDRRLAALNALRGRIQGESDAPLGFGELAGQQVAAAERLLLERIEEALAFLRGLNPDDQARIRRVLATITSGQELDLLRFAPASADLVIALKTRAEFEDYTYRVAGCVGVFWTHMCLAHLFPASPLLEANLLRNGVWFGQGLQMVNILRDLPRDLLAGRCYLPSDDLARMGLQPADLRIASNESIFRPLYNELLDQAEARLAAGWDYTNALPRRQFRVRLACALPILIGVRTLRLLRREPVLLAGHRVKMDRGEVWRWLIRAAVSHFWPRAWQGLFERARRME